MGGGKTELFCEKFWKIAGAVDNPKGMLLKQYALFGFISLLNPKKRLAFQSNGNCRYAFFKSILTNNPVNIPRNFFNVGSLKGRCGRYGVR